MKKLLILPALSVLASTQSFAFNQFEVFGQVQHAHLTREYESHFLVNGEKNRSYNGLDAKVALFEFGVSAPIYRNINIVGTISIGDDKRQNELWINQYSLENNIGTPPSSGGYNEYSDGHLKVKYYKVGIEQQTNQLLTTGIYLAKEEVDSRTGSGTLHSSSIPATKYFEDSFKLDGYSDIRGKTYLRNISVGIQNIISLRRSDVSQSFWHNGENNWVNFTAPSVQLLSSPYMIIDMAPNLSMRMSITHTVFKALRQKDVEFESTTLTQVSNVGVDAYSGTQTNFAFSANYRF